MTDMATVRRVFRRRGRTAGGGILWCVSGPHSRSVLVWGWRVSETFHEGSESREGFVSGGSGTFREVSSGAGGLTSRESMVAWGVGPVRVGLLGCLSERFTVLGSLPAGGESDVLLVTDSAGERWVVKQYRQPGWSPSLDVLDLLEDLKVGHSAASWASDERTRHVVWLQEWGTDPASGLFYEVQEFVAGGALAAGGGSSMGDWPAGVLAEALIDAVAGFHRLVGAHRDLKPGNLLVRSADPLVLVVADVGLSRNVGETSHRFSKRDGSPAYQAPEAAAQGKVSRAGDWWAVGVMIAEAVLGRHPMALDDGSLSDERVLLTEVVERDISLEGVSDPRLRLLCEGLLTRDSEQRWRLPQISAWRAGESPKTGYLGGQGAVAGAPVRTVLFGGRDYDSPQGLAAAFAADPGRAGELLFLAGDQVLLEDLRLMLGAHGLHEAQGYVSSYRSGVWQPSFLRLLVEMDPNLPPELAGQSMTPVAIADLASEVLSAGEVTESQRESVRWVTDHAVWRLWRRLEGMSDAPEAAARLMGYSAADGVGMCESAPVDKDTMGRFWDGAAVLGQAWMLWWAVDPDAASERLNTVLEPLRSAGEVKDQSWWHDLASTNQDSAEVERAARIVTAVVGYPLAFVAQRDADRRMVEAQEQRERANALKRADIQQVRDVMLPWLARQGQGFLETRRGQLRKELKSARRRSLRASSEQRAQQVWDSLARLRYSLVHRYGAQFSTSLDDAGFEQSPKKWAVIERELETDPLEWCGWADQYTDGWIPPSPILLAFWGSIEDGRPVGGLVDPIVRDLVGRLHEEPDELGRTGHGSTLGRTGHGTTFGRTGHGRIRVGQTVFPSCDGAPDAVIQQDVVPWSIPGPQASWVEVRLVHKRVEVTQTSSGQCILAFSTHAPALANVVFSMPDGELALATLSAEELQIWDLRTSDASSIRLTRFAGAKRLFAPETGGAW